MITYLQRGRGQCLLKFWSFSNFETSKARNFKFGVQRDQGKNYTKGCGRSHVTVFLNNSQMVQDIEL